MMLWGERDVVKPSESKILNTLNVSNRFDRLRPVKIDLGGLLEIEKVFIGLLGSVGLLGLQLNIPNELNKHNKLNEHK